jgi:phenylacetate-CoA ligase
MSKLSDRIYSSCPVVLQHLGIAAYGWFWSRRRFGSIFEKTWRDYNERESWSHDRFDEYIAAQLQFQVRRAYEKVPYYRASFQKFGVSEDTITNFKIEDLAKLPLLEKAKVRENPASLLTEDAARRPPQSFSTSGTTGAPIRVFWDSETHQRLIGAREARSFQWAGVSYRCSRSMIGGRLIVPNSQSRGPYWRYNPWEKQLYLSAFHIGPQTVRDYVKALNRFKPTTMTGYASANFYLSRFIQEANLEVHGPKAIITCSERLEPHMRSSLEATFGARVFEEYGSVENCALATECEYGRMHVHLDFGLVEILRPDGKHAKPGEVGELVVTGFSNLNQLFIRYRIGDLASWAADQCPCGRNTLPVLSNLIGRIEDTVVTPDGKETVRFHGLFIDLAGISEGQLIQEDYERFRVNIVPTNRYAQSDGEAICSRLKTRLGPAINVSVSTVSSIPREANGKYRAVVSRVKRSTQFTGIRDGG